MSIYNWQTVKEYKGFNYQIAENGSGKFLARRVNISKPTNSTSYGSWATREAATREIERRTKSGGTIL